MFTAAMDWHGGYVGAVNNMPGMGLFASYTTTGGAGPWTGRIMATGGPGGDSLPMVLGHPHVTFDNFGNLFLTYFTSSPLQLGTTTGGNTATTLNDTTRTWGINEWLTSGTVWVQVGSMSRRIVSNTATQLTIDQPWDQIPAAGAQYTIRLDAGVHMVTVAMSTNGGQTFSWLANFPTSAGGTGPGTSPPDDQPAIATGPGGTVAPGSVWVAWHSVGANQTSINVAGASVSGLGVVGAFGTAQQPSNASGKKFPSLSVGPNGQLLVAYASDLEMMFFPYHATVYTALDPDGLGPQGFNAPVSASATNVIFQMPIPPSPNYYVHASPDLAWDRSGGAHNGRVYLVYTNRPTLNFYDVDTNIFFRYSDNNGATWSAPVQVNDNSSGSQFWPSISVDQTTGNVAVVWYDPRNDPGNTRVQLYGTASDDGGVTFAPNVAIAAALSKASGAEDHMQGTSTGGNGARTLNDTTQNWAINWWGPYGAVPLTQVHITSGAGADPNTFYDVVSNSADQIVIDRDWEHGIPDATSGYEFALRYKYAYGGYTDVAFHGGQFYPVWADNSNSTLDNPDGANKPLDIYTAAVTVNGRFGPSRFGPQSASSPRARHSATILAPRLDLAGFLPVAAQANGIALASGGQLPALKESNTSSLPGQAGQADGLRPSVLDLPSAEQLFATMDGESMSGAFRSVGHKALAFIDHSAEDWTWTDDWLIG
jgi:hypothetical protein